MGTAVIAVSPKVPPGKPPEEEAREWYLRKGEVVIGPLTLGQIRALRDRGLLQPAHEVSRDQQKWQAVNSQPLFSENPVPEVGREPKKLSPVQILLPGVLRGAVLGGLLLAAFLWGLTSGALWKTHRQLREIHREYRDLQKVHETLEQENIRLKAYRDDLTIQVEQLEKDKKALKKRLEETNAPKDVSGKKPAGGPATP